MLLDIIKTNTNLPYHINRFINTFFCVQRALTLFNHEVQNVYLFKILHHLALTKVIHVCIQMHIPYT